MTFWLWLWGKVDSAMDAVAKIIGVATAALALYASIAGGAAASNPADIVVEMPKAVFSMPDDFKRVLSKAEEALDLYLEQSRDSPPPAE